MGKKKACSCGYWNEAQQECLYAGSACIRDDERKKPIAPKGFVEKWWIIFKEYQAGQHSGQLSNFLEQMINELGLEVEKK